MDLSKFSLKSFRTLALKRLGKRFFKTLGIILATILMLVTALHFWLVDHAEEIIQNLVQSKSNGQIQLKVESFRFNWFSTKIELRNAVFYTTDTVEGPTSYRFAVKKIKVRVRSIFPLIFSKQLLIKSLDLNEPDITVTRLRPSRDTADKEDVSLPQEMGRIYNSIQDALEVLQVKRFDINNARFTLANRISPDDKPVVISNIDFHMENLRIDSSRLTGREKIFFSDSVVLKSRDQDILFPDGRHRLSFKNFRINIDKKLVEFDSCTIGATKTDSSGAAFSVFFDKLMMTNIDFDTLYRNEVIKADSVFALNPRFNLDVERNYKKSGSTKVPQLDKIIQQLTGDLLLNFVVVTNADFDINVKRDGVPSSFTSQGNNFEMQGLRIDGKAEKPLKIKSFAMAIRNYENFLKDSSYAMLFDSILFNNDHILLHDFSLRQIRGGKTVNDLTVSRFELVGLSWDNLLFERKLVAREATLFHPTINYEVGVKNGKAGRSTNIFQALASINDFLMLEKLKIIQGQIDLVLNKRTELHMKNATMSVQSRELLGSHQLKTIRQSIDHLECSEGVIRNESFSVGFRDIYYTGSDSKFRAAAMKVSDREGKIDASASNVNLDEVFVDEVTGDIKIHGVAWKKADLKLNILPSGSRSDSAAGIQLTNINGQNTAILARLGQRSVKTQIHHILADDFTLNPGERPRIQNLDIAGSDLVLLDTTSEIRISNYKVKDKQSAAFTGLRYEKITDTDSIEVKVPELTLVPDIMSVINGATELDAVQVNRPDIRIRARKPPSEEENSGSGFLPFHVGKLVVNAPNIDYENENYKGKVRLQWKGQSAPGNSITISNARVAELSASVSQVLLSLNNFLFTDVNGRRFDTKNGKVDASLDNIQLERRPGDDFWQAHLRQLEVNNFLFDSLGKRAGTLVLDKARLNDLNLGSETFRSMRKLAEKNSNFRLSEVTGEYIDSVDRFRWYGGSYEKQGRMITLDSFQYQPTPGKESFVASHQHPADYIQARTGKIRIGPFDLDRYLKDTIMAIETVHVQDLDFSDYRDNRKPRRTGIIKPLPVDRIKKIKGKVSIDSILFDNARTLYTEISPKTGKTAEIPVTRMTVRVFPVRNFDLTESDSLRIQANGYLMDSIWLRLRLKESYLDSLSGFLFTLRVKPVDMKVLNPILLPLVSAKLTSGYLDTLSLRVSGTEYVAYGDMRMLYHDLRVSITRQWRGKESRLCNAILNFIVNTFVFRNKNTHRTGSAYFVRNRERGPLNYLIKTTMNGITNSIGAKSNRRIMREYKRLLKERPLPPVDYD